MAAAALTPALSGLAGGLRLAPGAPLGHSLRSTRPQAPARLLIGQGAAAVPTLLASLFSLCGPVHRLCAELALQAVAMPAPVWPSAAQRRALQWHTLREHVMRITLDWPRQLVRGGAAQRAAVPAGLALLAGCPLLGQPPQDDAAWARRLDETAAWLAQRLFRQPLAAWLQAWQADPATALRAWCAREAGVLPLAQWLVDLPPLCHQRLPAVAPLLPHARPAALQALVAALLADAGLADAPQWQGACAETGPWTRLHGVGAPLRVSDAPDRAAADRARALDTPWLRLGARLAELAGLALPAAEGLAQGPGLLSLGALPLPGHAGAGGRGEPAAVAWVETARGLLVHALWCTPGTPATLADVRVLAPTDWNSHPQGGWAQALSALPSDVPAAAVQALVAAYDPCVPCDIAPSAPMAGTRPRPMEAGHA